MCGIVGYIGTGAVADILLNGLKNLEYRGYDSAGLALNDNHKISVYKAEGKLNNLYNIINNTNLSSNIYKGIGHIRWATHGKPTINNAHPHVSNDEKLVLVHNGIIENYQELKEQLKKDGFIFHSSTDTETAVHLIDKEYKICNNLEKAVIKAVKQLKGAFAFCIMHQDEPNKIIAVRNHAPLILGLGDRGNFIASDIPAIIGVAKDVIYLDDKEIAVVEDKNLTIKDFDGITKIKQKEPLNIEEESISKRGYEHFMLKEISEQPDIIRKLLSINMPDFNQPITFGSCDIHNLIKGIEKIEIIACGTSLHASKVAKSMIERLARIPVEVTPASEYIYKTNLTDEKTLSIGISQSGETADTITAVRQAKEAGAKILTITNRPNSNIVRYSDAIIPLHAGIEVSVAATKSYTAQVMVLSLLAISLAEIKEKITKDYALKLKEELKSLPTKMEEVLNNNTEYKNISSSYLETKNFIYMARGINLATAYEGALKLKEISYINASGYAAGELKHGPIALLDENMPVLAILVPNTSTYSKVLSNCEEAHARHAPIIAVTSKDAELPTNIFKHIIRLPEISEVLSPILYALPMQMLAYYIASLLNREVDQPRNLAKSVTVE